MFNISSWIFSRCQYFSFETFQDVNMHGSGSFCFKVEILTARLSRLKSWNVGEVSRMKCWKSKNVEILKCWTLKCWNIDNCNAKCINLVSTFQHFNISNISTFQPWEKPLTIRRPGSKVPAHSKRTFQCWNLEKCKSWNVEMLKPS